MPFSFRRDSEISPSEKSSQTAPCVFRSIRTPTLRPFSSVTNWIPVMALFSFRRRHTRIVHVQPRPRNSASLPFPPIFSGIQKGPYATRRTETPVPAMHGRPPRMSGRREIRLPISVTVAGKLRGISLGPLRPGRARRILPPHSTRVGDLLQNLVLRQRAYDLAAARAGEFRRARIERLVKAVPRAVPLCEAAAAILAAVDGLRAQVRVNSLVEIVAGPRRRGPAIEEPLRPRLALVRPLVAGAPATPLSTTIGAPTATIGGLPARILFSGLAPGLVGVWQINAIVPENAPAGDNLLVQVSIDGATSNTVTMAVAQ